MNANPVLKKLGLTESDRVLIIHADDIGMCHATLPAMADLIDFGLVSCASVMVPLPLVLAVGGLLSRTSGGRYGRAFDVDERMGGLPLGANFDA